MKISKFRRIDYSQDLSLPKNLDVKCNKVVINRLSPDFLILPVHNPWDVMLEAVHEFEKEFIIERLNQNDLSE